MPKKRNCPFTNSPCIRASCALWIQDMIRVTNLKDGKSGIKDNSNCALAKLGEDASMRMWRETEKIIEDKPDPYKNCSRNPNDNCPHFDGDKLDIPSCKECEFWRD